MNKNNMSVGDKIKSELIWFVEGNDEELERKPVRAMRSGSRMVQDALIIWSGLVED